MSEQKVSEALRESVKRLSVLLTRGDISHEDSDAKITRRWLRRIRAALPLALQLEQDHARLTAQVGELQNTIDSMLRCVGKNAANVDDPVGAIKNTYRDLVGTREQRDELQKQLDAALRSADLWEQTAKLGRNLMKCGHQEMWAYSHDGGKNGFCLLCRNAQWEDLQKQLDARTVERNALHETVAKLMFGESK